MDFFNFFPRLPLVWPGLLWTLPHLHHKAQGRWLSRVEAVNALSKCCVQFFPLIVPLVSCARWQVADTLPDAASPPRCSRGAAG